MAAIRPTVGAVAAVWGTSGGRGAGEDKIFRPIGARFAPPMAAIRPTVGAAAAVWGTSGGRGAGEDKIFRPIGARFAPLWLPFGPL